MKTTIKVAFEPADLAALDADAAAAQTSRAALIRQRTLHPNSTFKLQDASYSAAVEAAATTIPGLPRNQIEHLVSRVIISLSQSA